MPQTVRTIQVGERTIILVGTAHISKESIEEAKETIRREQPQRVCVEIDQLAAHSYGFDTQRS